MIFCSWNTRGLNDPLKQREVVSLLHHHRIDVLDLIETRVKLRRSESIIKGSFNAFHVVCNYDSHLNGRIWVLSRKSSVHLTVLAANSQFVHAKVTHLTSQICYLITVVYGSNSGEQRRALWRDMANILSSVNTGWLVLGDFNVVRIATERISSCPVDLCEMEDFNNCVSLCHLEDLKGGGANSPGLIIRTGWIEFGQSWIELSLTLLGC
ncbi:hypothetical protein RND81_04G125000 [Saponaria officinalis]|uniref:Endonuclease/exonuclease/phosphatase domain-containing protein n=1 Tax=Saponaria officinalis TaxID=3572 RepID=A0AAW1LIS9_SAPOF